jgi:hypothetical protein
VGGLPGQVQRRLTVTATPFQIAVSAYDENDQGYTAIMSTRPDTIAAALMDSPAGLAA